MQRTARRTLELLRRLEITLTKMLTVYAYCNITGLDAQTIIRQIHELHMRIIEAKQSHILGNQEPADKVITDATNFLLRKDV